MAGTRVAKATKRQSKEPGRFDDEFDDYSQYFPVDMPPPEPPKRRASRARGKSDEPARSRPAKPSRTAAGRSRPKTKAAAPSATPESPRRRLVAQDRPKKRRKDAVAQPAETSSPAPMDPVAEMRAEINESVLSCNRCFKACVQFARDAGLALLEARRHLGEDEFGAWVNRALPLSAAEALALIRYCEDPRVAGVDVSPATAMPVRQAAELVAPLCRHLVGQPAAPDTADPEARRKGRRPRRPR